MSLNILSILRHCELPKAVKQSIIFGLPRQLRFLAMTTVWKAKGS